LYLCFNSGKFKEDSKRAEISRAIPITDIPSGLLAVIAKSYIKSFNLSKIDPGVPNSCFKAKSSSIISIPSL